MFDISWVDPTAETIAQRRNRKDREDGKSVQRGRRSSLAGSVASSHSTGTSKAQKERAISPTKSQITASSIRGSSSINDKSSSIRGSTSINDVSSSIRGSASQAIADVRSGIPKRQSPSPPNPWARIGSSLFSIPTREDVTAAATKPENQEKFPKAQRAHYTARTHKPKALELWAGDNEIAAHEPQHATRQIAYPQPVKSFSYPIQEKEERLHNGQPHELWAGTSRSTNSSYDSNASDWHERPSSSNSASDSTKTTEIQPLSPMSFITRSTEVTVTVSQLDSSNILKYPASEVHISADVAEDFGIHSDRESEPYSAPSFPSTPPVMPLPIPPLPSRSPSRLPSRSSSLVASPHPAPREPYVGSINTPPTLPADLWRPPQNWGCPPEPATILHQTPVPSPPPLKARTLTPRRSRSNLSQKNILSSAETESAAVRRQIRRMEAASPKVMLDRLREEWADAADATILNEMEFEKQLWMLTALKWMTDRARVGSTIQPGTDGVSPPAPTRVNVLSLYESKASASFFATHSNSPQIHHLAALPIASSLQPSSSHAFSSPEQPSPLHIPYAASLFTKITSLPLPTLLPSSSLPSILRECHRLLTPAGTLLLTILDPCPTVATLGPKLRSWLEEFLLLRLEVQFRCISPGRLVPIWLMDGGFVSRTVAVDMVVASPKPLDAAEGASPDPEAAKRAADEADLQALVSRMLWKEIWGSFVIGERFWWEDEEIMEECQRLGTRWECKMIEATKRS